MSENIRRQFGNYRLIHLVGHGGFAEVYLSEHIYLRTQAAIKVLHLRLTEDILQDFLNEARTIAHLIHPGIVRILDFGVENTVPFLVMDYAPNGTLRQRHPRGSRLPLATIVSYIRQVAPALYYAHTQRLIHRDVKPENMLIGQNNNLLLSDFGLVLIAQSTSSQSTKEMAGTVPYMAPEQLQGRPRPASDQYALGIIVYEWLSGERPFQGSFAEVASQHLLVPPPPLYGRIPGISPAVEQVVFTALAKDPQQRFASVQAFATAFEQACLAPHMDLQSSPWQVQSWQSTFVNTPSIELSQPKIMTTLTNESAQSTLVKALPDRTVQSTFTPLPSSTSQATTMMSSSEVSSVPPTIIVPPDQPPSIGRKVPRRTIVVSLAGGIALVGGGTTWLALNLGSPKTQPVGINHHSSPTSIPASTTPTIAKNTPDPTAKVVTTPTTRATSQPTAQPTAALPPRPTLVWRYQTGGAVGASPTLFGNTLYVGSFDGNMYAINAINGSVIWQQSTGNSITWSAATVANNILYFGSKDTYVYALHASDGSLLWKYQTQGEVDNKPSIVNGILYISSVDGNVYALKATTGSPIWKFQTGAAIGSSPVVVNNIIYIGSQNGIFYALDATTGSPIWSFSTGGSGFAKLATVSNGIIYVGAFDSNVYALEASTGKLIWRYTTGGSVYSSPALSNGTIYVGSDDGFLYALNANTTNPNGERLWRFPTIGTSPSNIRSSPLVVNGIVFFGSWDRNFYAVNAANGSMRWYYPTGGYVESIPSYNNGIVYFGSADHNIYALRVE